MFGLFGMFGRSRELRQLDKALRSVDLHPSLVPEAVELAATRLLREECGTEPDMEAYVAAAELIAYCMLGADSFAGLNDGALAEAVEERIQEALEADDSLDARLVLLTLHAKVIQPSVVARFGLEADFR